MKDEEIIKMTRQAGFGYGIVGFIGLEKFDAFAKLVAKHTMMNIDPSSFMSYQEGFEAGVAKEREACAKICDEFCYGNTKILVEKAIRARGNT